MTSVLKIILILATISIALADEHDDLLQSKYSAYSCDLFSIKFYVDVFS